MEEILRNVVKWTEENKLIPEIYFYSKCGGIYLKLKLHYHRKCMAHDIYIPGGVLCLTNWDMFPMNEEINAFIELAKRELLGGE